MKQTAVEWLIQKLTNRENGFFDGFPHLSIDKIYEQAKQMEKEQIIDAANTLLYHSTGPGDTAAEQYYQETFKKD
jgi:hypothetical protein